MNENTRRRPSCPQVNRFEVMDVNLEGPKRGEVLIESRPGLCHIG